MLGFVSALSSTVAILVLVMTISMLNSLSHMIEQEKSNNNFSLSEVDKEGDYESPFYQGGIISIKAISSIKKNESIILITCSYGKNFNKKLAQDFLIYNYLKVKNNLPNRQVAMSLVFESDKVNNCKADGGGDV